MNELRFADPLVRASTALELGNYRTTDEAGWIVAAATARARAYFAAGHDAPEMAKGVGG